MQKRLLTNLKINWCEFVNRADGISEIEGKGRRGDRASRAGSEFQIRVCQNRLPKKFQFR